MNYLRLKIIVFLYLFLFGMTGFSLFSQGYEIKVNIEGMSEGQIIFGHYLNKSIYPDDTIILNNKGKGVLKGDKSLQQGMYVIYLPDNNYFELIIGEDQMFGLTTDTSDYIYHMKFEGSAENEIFSDFQKYMISKKSLINELKSKLANAKNEKEKSKIKESFAELDKERINKIKSLKQEHPGLFVTKFLNATLEIEVPDPPKNEKGEIIDSTWQYHYYKSHYFDNFDISDLRMLHTPLYEEKIMNYLTKIIPQIPDSINKGIDLMVEASRSDSALFRYMLITLFNHYGKSNLMGMDAVQVHIAEKYYIKEATWSDPEFIHDLKKRIEEIKPLLIGKSAPDMKLLAVPKEHFIDAENDTALKRYPHAGSFIELSKLSADYFVLIFWEADCGHCKRVVPELYRIYNDTLKDMNIKVLAISTLFGEDGKEKWVDFVNKHKIYDWINAWNPYDYKYKLAYDIKSTPQIFVLDKEKTIIAKKIGADQIPELIKNYKRISK